MRGMGVVIPPIGQSSFSRSPPDRGVHVGSGSPGGFGAHCYFEWSAQCSVALPALRERLRSWPAGP